MNLCGIVRRSCVCMFNGFLRVCVWVCVLSVCEQRDDEKRATTERGSINYKMRQNSMLSTKCGPDCSALNELLITRFPPGAVLMEMACFLWENAISVLMFSGRKKPPTSSPMRWTLKLRMASITSCLVRLFHLRSLGHSARGAGIWVEWQNRSSNFSRTVGTIKRERRSRQKEAQFSDDSNT